MQHDAIVVLGSGVSASGELFPQAIKRVEKAVGLFRAGSAGRMIMSGSHSRHMEELPRKTEAQAMKEFAVSLGVPAEFVFTENRSRDTFGNVLFTKRQFLVPNHWRNIVVVTSDYHTERVRFLCKKILGAGYVFTVEGVQTGISSDERDERLEREKRKLSFTIDHLASIPDGDDEKLELQANNP